MEEKISALPSLNIHTKQLKRKLIGHVTDCELDKATRILIPSTLKHYTHIDKIMSGQGHNFELWDEDIWHKQFDSLDTFNKQTQIPIEIAQLSL